MHYKTIAFIIMSTCANAQVLQPRSRTSDDGASSVVITETGFLGDDHQKYTGVIKLMTFQHGKAVDDPIFIEVDGGSFSQRIKATNLDSYYLAVYISDNRVARFEKWEVPNVDYPLRIVDVSRGRPDRVQVDPDSATTEATGGATIPESNVIGLTADLGIRAIIGPSYAPNRVAVVDANGLLVGATGNPAACLTVSGTPTPCLPVGTSAATNGQTLVYSSATGTWIPGSSIVSLGGDIGGTSGAAIVTGIQSYPVSRTAPAAGQVLTWNAIADSWTPGSPPSGLGFSLTQISSTTAMINTECTTAAPCRARFGETIMPYTSAASVTLSSASGSGQVLFYVDASGFLQIIHNLIDVSCNSNCIVTSSQSPSFPQGSIPLWSCMVASGSWTSNCTDLRAPLSALDIVAGSGIVTIDTGSQLIVSVDSFSEAQVSQAQSTVAVGEVANAACVKTADLSLPGAIPGDPVTAGWSLPPLVIGYMQVVQADTISATICNFSGTTVTLGSLSLRAQITSGPPRRDMAQATKVSIKVSTGQNPSQGRIAYCYGSSDCTQGSRRGYVPLENCGRVCTVTFVQVFGTLKYKVEQASAGGTWISSEEWQRPDSNK